MSAPDDFTPLYVPAREVPVPSTLSARLQRYVAQPVPPIASMPTTPEGWRQLQREEDAEAAHIAREAIRFVEASVTQNNVAGVACFDVIPRVIAPENERRLIVHIHGGAFVFNAGIAAAGEAALLADACQMRALSIDYRMPPDHPFPAASDDVLAVWKAVIAEREPRTVAMAGTSAGAALIMTTMLRLDAENLPKPGAVFLGTPGADRSKTGDSMFLNAEVDNLLGRYEGRMKACLDLYANGHDLNDPMLSPISGDLSNFPPTLLITGTRDLLLSDTVRTHRKLRAANVIAELHVFEAMSHAAYLTSFPSPESRDALREIAQFFDRHIE